MILYLPPDLVEALDERRGKTGLSRNETLLRMIRRFLAPDDLPKPPKKWKAPDENEAFRENLEKVHADRDKRAEIAPEVFEDTTSVVPAEVPWDVSRECPNCGGYVIIRGGSGSCRNKCGWTGKVKP